MKSMLKVVAVSAALLSPAFGSAASAEDDIPWTWNSGDQDARAKFAARGETYSGQDYRDNPYMDWTGPSGSGRWFIPGSNGSTQTFDMNWPEGKTVSLKVCADNGQWPDDCSSRKYGVS